MLSLHASVSNLGDWGWIVGGGGGGIVKRDGARRGLRDRMPISF